MTSHPGWMKKTVSTLTAFALATNGAFANSLFPDAEEIIDTSRTFNMQVQHTPYTSPKNPAYRTLKIDCGTLGAKPNNGRIMPLPTESFLRRFDLPPYLPEIPPQSRTRETESRRGLAMMAHLGSLTGENQSHQLCVGQAEQISGKAKRQGGTSTDLANDRYCPPLAAVRLCSKDPKAQEQISPIWRWDAPTNTLVIVPENL